MSEPELFLRQDEANALISSISDPVERLLVQLSLCHTISALAFDPDYQARFRTTPMDLLSFVRAAHQFLRHKDLLRSVLDGEVKHIDQCM